MDPLSNITRRVAVSTLRLFQSLPTTPSFAIVGRQLVRCGTSVGANYRAARRAKSKRDFIAKLAIVEEEADEVLYWLEMLQELGLAPTKTVELQDDADHVVSMVVKSIRTARTQTSQDL